MIQPDTTPAIHPLRVWRGARTLLAAAAILKTSAAQLSRYENWIYQPRAKTAERISKGTGLTIAQVCGLAPYKLPRKRRQSEARA